MEDVELSRAAVPVRPRLLRAGWSPRARAGSLRHRADDPDMVGLATGLMPAAFRPRRLATVSTMNANRAGRFSQPLTAPWRQSRHGDHSVLTSRTPWLRDQRQLQSDRLPSHPGGRHGKQRAALRWHGRRPPRCPARTGGRLRPGCWRGPRPAARGDRLDPLLRWRRQRRPGLVAGLEQPAGRPRPDLATGRHRQQAAGRLHTVQALREPPGDQPESAGLGRRYQDLARCGWCAAASLPALEMGGSRLRLERIEIARCGPSKLGLRICELPVRTIPAAAATPKISGTVGGAFRPAWPSQHPGSPLRPTPAAEPVSCNRAANRP